YTTAVAAAHNAWTKSVLQELMRECDDERRLAASTGREIADDDHRHGQSQHAQDPATIQRAAQCRRCREQRRQRRQQQRQRSEPPRVPITNEDVHGARAALQTRVTSAAIAWRT